jgi:hypothetical protein
MATDVCIRRSATFTAILDQELPAQARSSVAAGSETKPDNVREKDVTDKMQHFENPLVEEDKA